jgi:hypothetical protein
VDQLANNLLAILIFCACDNGAEFERIVGAPSGFGTAHKSPMRLGDGDQTSVGLNGAPSLRILDVLPRFRLSGRPQVPAPLRDHGIDDKRV